MRPIVHCIDSPCTPEKLAANLSTGSQTVLLRSGRFDAAQGRYSFVTAHPFLTFRSFGARCEITVPQTPDDPRPQTQFGNPWHLLDSLMARYELLDEIDLPFPLGGCFGYWGYDLKGFIEPKLRCRAVSDLEWPDCQVGFYDSLVAFDHLLDKAWIISTGLRADGSRDEEWARERLHFWQRQLAMAEDGHATAGVRPSPGAASARGQNAFGIMATPSPLDVPAGEDARTPGLEAEPQVHSSFTEPGFINAVERAQRYIRAGDIYQVNLSQRLTADWAGSGWDFFTALSTTAPAPFSAFLDAGDFQIASSSPELFLSLSGAQILTRPIKGTRPRSHDPARDAQLSYELQTSGKEMAELVMITDLLRNDLGRVCEYGSVVVPELTRLERYAHVQHLVSTVEGRLRPDMTHFRAFASCFPGGSVTGAPKFRAMEIIDELEPVARGPYTGAIGYLGFNRESQLSITIRAGFVRNGAVHFQVGAGIVADSDPAAEYEETLTKAQGFLQALSLEVSHTQQSHGGHRKTASTFTAPE